MTMKLTVGQIHTTVQVISTILRERRPMPQRGKFALAKMHTALLPKWEEINEQRDELIKSYNHHPVLRRAVTAQDGEEDIARGYVEKVSDEFGVPDDKAKDFAEKWKILGEDEVECDVKPISVRMFDLGTGSDGSIEGAEIIEMGNLVTE